MVAITDQEIHNAIISYIDRDNVSYTNWYVGITSDPDDRLFNQHNVDRNKYGWIYEQALTHENARYVERFIIDKYGAAGGTGGGDNTSVYVYAYKKSSYTNP